MEAIEALRAAAALVTALVGALYFYQMLYLIVPFFARKRRHSVPVPNRVAVLIAARNEQSVLPYLIDSIHAQNYPRELISIYVIADNCTDSTAAIARERGAEVYERHDTEHVGKGYALSWLLRLMELEDRLDRHDIFLIFDADNLLEPDYISRINQCFSDGSAAVCGCRLSKNPADSWISAGNTLWYIHDSVHLNASRALLGTSCAVNGTGFGFTRELCSRMGGWQFFTLTEDIEFNAWCAVNGVQIDYCPQAVLYDEQPVSFRQSWRQRTRWVQGGIQVSLKYGRELLYGALHGSWACLETLTLSVWGYGLCALSALLSLTAALLTGGFAEWLISAAVGTYAGLLVMGLMALISKWGHIHAPVGKKLLHCLAFPVFMATYIPIGICALFCKFQWLPIHHTVAVPIDQMHR